MAQYTSKHTGSQLDTVITDVLSKSEKWTNKIDDVKVNGTSIVSDKVANVTVDQSYSATSTNAQSGIAVASAIESAITNVINADY